MAGAPPAILRITGLELVEGLRFSLAGDGRAGKAGQLGCLVICPQPGAAGGICPEADRDH